MRYHWKPRYLLPLAMAASVGMSGLALGQEGAPDAVDNLPPRGQSERPAERETAAEAEIDAELAGEAPRGDANPSQPEVVERQDDANRRDRKRNDAAPNRPRDGRERPDERRRDRFAADMGFRYEALPHSGLRIVSIDRDSLSARAGFRTGDRILRVGPQAVATWDDFHRAMSGHYGQRVPVYVDRDGRRMPIHFDLTQYQAPPPLVGHVDADHGDAQRAGFGIGLTNVDNVVVVSRVYPASPAARDGVRVGDVILRANGREIQHVDELVGYIRSLSPGDDLVLNIRRDGYNERIASRLAPWDQAMKAAPPEEIYHVNHPDQLHFDPTTRINALEERLQDLEAAVRGLRDELRGIEPATEPHPTQIRQHDVEIEAPPREVEAETSVAPPDA